MAQTTTVLSHRSVRTHLVWLVLACLLPGVIGASVLFAYEFRNGRAQLEKDTLLTARALVQAVDNHLLRGQAVAQALATSDLLVRGDFARFHRQAREAIERTGLGTNVVLRDVTGLQLINTAVDYGHPLPTLRARGHVRGVFETGQPTIADIFISSVLKRPLMSVDVPVVVNGKVAYALGVGLFPEHFNAILQSQKLPSGWIAAVLDSSGTIVARSHAPERFIGQKVVADLLSNIARNAEGAVETISKEGVPVLSVFTTSPTTNWRVAIGIPRQQLLADLLGALAVLATGVAILFGIGLALAWNMGGRIAHSVRALTAPATALGEGKVPSIPPVELREAAEVAAAIGRASDLLDERASKLETKEVELTEVYRLAKFGTWYWDLATGHVDASDSIRDIYGRDTIPNFPEMRGTLLPIESWEHVNAAVQEMARTGRGYDLELRVNHGSGHTIWINAKCEVVRNEAGQVVALRGAVLDITERKHAEEELRKFKFFSDYANDGHLLVDQSGNIRYANKLACERLGYSEVELLCMNIADICPPESNEPFHRVFARSKQARIPPFEGLQRRKDGSAFPVEITATVLEVSGEWLMFTTSRDITERKEADRRIREVALHDPLTGLPNRALVFEYCDHALAAAQRNHGRGALLFIDLDRFKPVNDLYGHEVGDRLLKEVGKRLVDCTRREDLVGRLGGDEFVVMLPYLDVRFHRAAAVARHVLDSLSQPFRIDALELSITPSIGISYFPDHAKDVGTLIHTADMAMYQAKQSGRANFQFYTADLDRCAEQAFRLEIRIRNALRHGGLKLHYQPVVDIGSGELIGAEALVRLADGDGEPVGPGTFIPVAESAGLIGDLGEWVAAEACRQQKSWSSSGIKLAIAINVSPLQFRQRAFAEKLRGIIAESGIDPTCLVIEVTESTVMDSIDDAIQILKSIKSLGVKIALDDFGTGYSSLSSLTSLPLDKLKVDQSFVRRIEHDEASRAVTEAIIALGRSLKLEIVGEGIESENTLRYLRESGCNQAQGYWFSRPLPPSKFAQWNEKRKRAEHTAAASAV